MKRDIQLVHYLLLTSGFVVYLSIIYRLSGNRSLQFLASVFFVFFYFVWGMIHHKTEKTLTFSTVLEYILISAVVLVLIEIFLVG